MQLAGAVREPSSPRTKVGLAGERYAGWLEAGPRPSGGLESYRTERVVDFDGGWAEVRRFAWSQPLESIWRTGARCYFLSLSLEGEAQTRRRNMALAPPGVCGGARVLLVPPDQTISSVCATSGRRRSLRCLIDAELVEGIGPSPPTAQERARLAGIDLGGSAIEWLLHRMYREIAAEALGVDIVVESLAREIAVEIMRTLAHERSRTQRRTGGLAPWRMRLVLDRIDAGGPPPQIRELAELSGVSARHLARAFHAETGVTLGRFMGAAMAKRAGAMLKAGVPVGVVAADLGYASSSSFAHAFRRETGLAPSSAATERAEAGSRGEGGRAGR